MTRIHGRPSPDAWQKAIAVAESAGMAYRTIYPRIKRAEALLDASGGRGADARNAATDDLVAAYELASRIGAQPLVDLAVALATRARVHLEARRSEVAERSGEGPRRATGEVDRFGLSPREAEVLAVLAKGRTNRQIARELFISEKTAAIHVSRILDKLGVSNRLEAAAVAYRLGLAAPGRDNAA
jgi:DNA-binding NarL/FixJ family response regulator